MLDEAIDAVVAQMRAQVARLAGPGGAALREMVLYHLGWETTAPPAASAPAPAGKLVRSRLCILSCQAVGGDATAAVPAAAAVEFIHNFSLIHDDIEDRDELRRGRPALWKRWGEAQAINAGDCMYSLAYAALTSVEAAADAGDPLRRLRAAAALSRACVALCEGQSHDLSLQSRDRVSEDEYLQLVQRKTGALMSCAAETGALLGGADDDTVRAFADFGSRLGVAFQIRDDLLGIWGDPALTGKPVGADLSRRRCSYPVVCALAQANDRERQAILGAHQAPSQDALAAAMAALERLGARQRAEQLAAEMRDRAWAALAGRPLEPRATMELRRLAEFLTARES